MTNSSQRSVHDSAEYHIDQIKISPLENTIERDGESFKVSPRAIQALAYLIEHAGRPITYSEINEAIWQGGCSENSFYQQIATLRKALGDDSSQPRYIKTIAKQGYLFIGSTSVKMAPGQDNKSAAPHSVNRFVLPAVLTLVSALLLLALLPSWLDLPQGDGSELDPRVDMYELVELIQSPKSTVVIERPDPADGSDLQRSLSNALILLTEYPLTSVKSQHVALIPRFSRTAMATDLDFYKKIVAHYHSVGGVSAILKPGIEINNGSATYSLKSIDPNTFETRVLLEWDVDRVEAIKGLAVFEQKILASLKALELVAPQTEARLSASADASGWFVEATQYFFKAAKTRSNLEDTIRLSQKAIESNPNNMPAYSMLWAETVKLLSIYSDYDIDAILKRVERTNKQALKLQPNYHRAALVNADSHCWLQDFRTCAKGMARSLTLRPYDGYSLDSLYWNVGARADLQLQVAQQNYNFNPFYHDAFADYRDALLANSKFHQLSEFINYHSQWSDSSDWFVQAQSETHLAQLQLQAHYYRQNFIRSPQETYAGDLLPSRYIGYSLLNANRPELARFWARHGMERDLPYFDLRVIELMSNLWQGDWQPLSWQVERAYVMERRKDQNSLDKLTIAYFDLQTGWQSKAAEVLEDLAPDLLAEDIQIDDGNLRLFVYYSEIQKRQGNLKYASRAVSAIKAYLAQRDSAAKRGIDFGLADVEYFALNNDRDKALQQLEHAVYQQDWLPNSLWLWPPLEHNPFLKSLTEEPRFKAAVERVNSRLASLCYEASCE